MGFMEPEISEKRRHVYAVMNNEGTFYYPGDMFTVDDVRRDFHPDAESVGLTPVGYLGRYSARGYMDATDWTFDTNKHRLTQELNEMYGDDE